jgi:methionyl-tRNA formyltransferase
MGLKIVFMGTPAFAVASLDALANSSHKVIAVVTTPDKPAGRGQKIQVSDVKQYALDNGIPVLQPEKLKDETFLMQLEKLDADIFVVVAFRMLPEMVWNIPHLGTINLHGSLLPQYRGAAPINWAIMNGETETGVTTFFIEKDIDTGSIIDRETIPIGSSETAGDLHDKMMNIGGKVIVRTIDALERRTIKPFPQSKLISNHAELISAPKIFKETCRIDWSKNGKNIFDHIRGLSPYPAAWTILKGEQDVTVKVFEAEFVKDNTCKKIGTITTDGKTYLSVAVNEGFISIKTLQLEGKKKHAINEFLRGFHGIEKYKFE